jgi:hypothetical protein
VRLEEIHSALLICTKEKRFEKMFVIYILLFENSFFIHSFITNSMKFVVSNWFSFISKTQLMRYCLIWINTHYFEFTQKKEVRVEPDEVMVQWINEDIRKKHIEWWLKNIIHGSNSLKTVFVIFVNSKKYTCCKLAKSSNLLRYTS